MLTNLPNRHSVFRHGQKSGFSVLEFLIVLAIIGIMFGAITAMRSPFQRRMQLRNSAFALAADLRLAQTYAMSQKDYHEYYGLRFYSGLGGDILPAGEPPREGWKIVRYEPQGLAPPVNFNSVTFIKSCAIADNPEIFDKTFFTSDRISLDGTSDFQVSPTAPQLHSIVFNKDGSATSDGSNFLTTGTQDNIVLSGFGYSVTLAITPLTGHIEVRDVQ